MPPVWWLWSFAARFLLGRCGGEVDAEQGVVVRQRPHADRVAVAVVACCRGPAPAVLGQGLAHPRGGRGMLGIGDDTVAGPRAGMTGHGLAVAGHRHRVQRGGHVDEPADRPRVDGVVDGVDPHVVVPAEPDPGGKAGQRVDRWQFQHRPQIGLQQIDRTAPDRPHGAGIRQRQPFSQLDVEILRGDEPPARQKRRLEIAVGPLDDTLIFRVPWRRKPDLGRQRSREPRRRRRHPAGPPDRRFPIPHQRLRDPPDPADQQPHARENVTGLPRGNHRRGQEPGERQRHHQHRKHPFLPRTHRNHRLREPQITMRELPRLIHHPVHRVDPDILRPDHRQSLLQRRQRIRPADPLRDHRRRHPRPLRQQRPDHRLERIDHRPARRPFVLRRPVRRQRRPHRVPRHTQPSSDLLDRNALSSTQPADLRPVLHLQHPSYTSRGSVFAAPWGVSFQEAATVVDVDPDPGVDYQDVRGGVHAGGGVVAVGSAGLVVSVAGAPCGGT
uniref:Uncharacterized protein n=1 Tax=Frankia sp. Ar15 TaxID=138945 RepID=Q9AL38_9ACTN|nr:unknown [Frankia sp. Ar15]